MGGGCFKFLLEVRSGAARTNCANNLRQVGVSSIAYMNNNTGPGNRSGFMPHVRGVDELDGPEDVGKIFEMLVRSKEIDDARIFICMGSEDIPISIGADERLSDFRFEAGTNVMDAPNFSYGWVKRQVTSSNARSSDAISADRALPLKLEESGWFIPPEHRFSYHSDGRNFLLYDGSVMFVPRDHELAATPDPDIRAMLDQLNIIPAR